MSGQKQEKLKILDGNRGMLKIYDDNIVFTPPLYRQRYQIVKDKIVSLSDGTFTKVMDMGSGEMKFFRYLLDVPGIQQIILLDKDDQTMLDNAFRINPLAADYLVLRSSPLNVKAVCGDASMYHSLLSGVHVVTMIELIEHMQISELPGLVKCVFQDIKPKLVIVTTPNADFNKYIPGFTPGNFRHWDHKFEWTTQEFSYWCQGIVQENTDYSVKFSGCGLGPENTYCTQIAVFLKLSSNQEELLLNSMREILTLDNSSSFSVCVDRVGITQSANNRSTPESSTDSHKILFDFDYPVDSRTQDEKDQDHILARFQSLKHYLVTGERQKQSALEWGEASEEDGKVENCAETLAEESDSLESQCQQASPLLKDSGSSEDDLVFFLVEYVTTEKGITPKEMANNEYIFYIVDNEYAVIPMKSLSKWVNLSADHMIPASLISLAVREDCFEAQGDGDEWHGKLKLWNKHDDSVDENVEWFDKRIEDQEKWLTDDTYSDDVEKLESDGSKTVHGKADHRTEDLDWNQLDVPHDKANTCWI